METEEVKAIIVESCQKMADEGWEFMRVDFCRPEEKLCCPLMAVALTHGYDVNLYEADPESEKGWSEIISEILDSRPEEWSNIWAGYDSPDIRANNAYPFRSNAMYFVGVELKQLFPPKN